MSWLRLTSLCALAWVRPATADTAILTTDTQQIPTEWVVQYRGRTVFRYAYPPGRFKPYVKELSTIDGRNILRDAPSDHLHHHALMYAIRAQGINFWEEIPGSGVQKPLVTTTSPPRELGKGVHQASLVQSLHWLTAEDAFLPEATAKTLLLEQRTLIVTVDESNQEVALQWRSVFEVGSATNEVTRAGANYFGLGARFLAELDAVAEHLTPAGRLDLSNNHQDVSQHPWAAVAFDSPTFQATFAVLGHPRNPGGSPWFFSMHSPFAYLSATENLDQKPQRLRKGEHHILNYLVITLPARATPESITARYARWLQTTP